MNGKQLSGRIGNIGDRLVSEAERNWKHGGHRRKQGRGSRRFAALAAVAALMACSFSAGAAASAKEIVIEVPAEQETIEIEELGLTLILPDTWKGKYALERTDNGEYHVYGPAIREAMGGSSGEPLSGGMLFSIMLWDERSTKAQVDAGGEWDLAQCEYIMATKGGTYPLYYASGVRSTEEAVEGYRRMESEISDISSVLDRALAG